MNDTVPLAVVAVELGTTADELATRFGDAITLDDAGIRCVPTGTARQLIDAHRAAAQAAREQVGAKRDEARRRLNPLRARVKALAAAQAQYDGDPSAPALARALANDPDSAFNRRSRNLDEQMSGQMVMHRIRREVHR